MAEKVGEIYYDVTLDLDQMIKDQRRAQQNLNKTADSLQRLAPIAAAAKAALSGLAVMKIIDMADEWGQYASRIKQATKSTEEYAQVQERMLQSANQTFRSINETRESFIQLSPVLREMGLSLGQSIDVIDTFSGLLVVNAASTEKAKGAQDALAKSLQKGKIDADAWMSIYSTLDSVVDIIAESSGKSAEEIRKLGAEGKLGIDVFVNALSDGAPKVAKQMAEMPTTVRDAIQSVTNGLQEYIGWSNEAHGITATIAGVVKTLGENFSTLADVALLAVTAGLARYVGGMTAAAVATAAKTAAARSAAIAELALAEAEVAQTAAALAKVRALSAMTANTAQVTAATLALEVAEKRLAAAQAVAVASSTALGAALKGILGFLGGPVGIAVMVALAAASVFKFGDSAAKAAPKVDLLTTAVNELGDANLKLMRTELMKKVSEMTAFDSAAGKANARIETLNSNLRQFPSHAKAKEWREEIERLEASTETESEALGKMRDQLKKVEDELAARQKGVSTTRVTRSDPEVQKRLAAMREEEELAKLTGVARARLQAIQKLGSNATAEERAEAERLATSIYNLEQAQKKLNETAKAGKFDSKSYLLGLRADATEAGLAKIDADEREALSKHKKLLDERKLTDQEYEEGATSIRQKAAQSRAEIARREAADALMVTNAELAVRRQLQVEIARQDADIAGASMGDRAREEMEQRLQLVQQFAQRAQQIEDQRRTALAQADEKDRARIGKMYDEVLRIEEGYQSKSLAAYDEYVLRKRSTDEDWMNGASRAWQNYAEQARDAASQAQSLFEKGFQGMEDALVSFVMTGKADFKNLAESIIADLVRIQIRASMVQLLGGSNGGGGGGLFGTLLSGVSSFLGASSAGTSASSSAYSLTTASNYRGGGQGLSFGGMRERGGDVSAGKMYEVNERGVPELLTVGNKQLLMMAGQSGSVTPLGGMEVASVPSPEGRGGGASGVNVQVQIEVNNHSGGEVKQRQETQTLPNGDVLKRFVLDIVGDSFASGTGAPYKGAKQRFGLTDS